MQKKIKKYLKNETKKNKEKKTQKHIVAVAYEDGMQIIAC